MSKDKWIIATDIDGTFISSDSNSSIHVNNFEAIKKLKEKGHHVVLTSGRSGLFLRMIYEQLNLDDPVISFHGAVLSDPQKKLIEFPSFKVFTPRELIIEIIDSSNYLDYTLSFHVVGEKTVSAFQTKKELKKLWYDSFETVLLFDFELYKKHKKEFEGHIFKYKDKVEYRFIDYSKEHGVMLLTISPKGTDKSKALDILAKYYEIPKERVIYFGDNLNDLEAIKWAGMGVAVGNSVKEVKEIADVVLEKTNNDGAVGKYLLELMDKKII